MKNKERLKDCEFILSQKSSVSSWNPVKVIRQLEQACLVISSRKAEESPVTVWVFEDDLEPVGNDPTKQSETRDAIEKLPTEFTKADLLPKWLKDSKKNLASAQETSQQVSRLLDRVQKMTMDLGKTVARTKRGEAPLEKMLRLDDALQFEGVLSLEPMHLKLDLLPADGDDEDEVNLCFIFGTTEPIDTQVEIRAYARLYLIDEVAEMPNKDNYKWEFKDVLPPTEDSSTPETTDAWPAESLWRLGKVKRKQGLQLRIAAFCEYILTDTRPSEDTGIPLRIASVAADDSFSPEDVTSGFVLSLRVSPYASHTWRLPHPGRNLMLQIVLSEDDEEGDKKKTFDCDLYVGCRLHGLKNAGKFKHEWRIQHLASSKVIRIHPNDSKTKLGSLYTINIQNAQNEHRIKMEVSAFIPAPQKLFKVGESVYTQLQTGGKPKYFEVPIRRGLMKDGGAILICVKIKDCLVPGADCSLSSVSDLGSMAVPPVVLCGSCSERYPDPTFPSQWKWRSRSDSGRSGYFEAPPVLAYSLQPQYHPINLDDYLKENKKHNQDDIVCSLLAKSSEMSMLETIYVSLTVDSKREHTSEVYPVGVQVECEVCAVEIKEDLCLEPVVRRKKQVFDQVYKQVNGSLISSQERESKQLKYQKQYTYGEVEFVPFGKELTNALEQKRRWDTAPDYGKNLTGIFYDVGCGTGKPLVLAAMTLSFERCIGIELLDGLYEAAVKVLHLLHDVLSTETSEHWELVEETDRRMHNGAIAPRSCKIVYCGDKPPRDILICNSLEVVQGDFTKLDWSDADMVYASSICFPDELMEQMKPFAERMKKRSKFMTLKKLESKLFETLSTSFCRMTWGKNSIYIQSKIEGDNEVLEISSDDTSC